MRGKHLGRSVLACLVQVMICLCAFGQETPVKRFSQKDGLPSGTIYSMLSDSKGYLWFATDAGVSRFDGHKFTNFALPDGLSENEILKIAEDSRGRIWFLGLSGTLSYYFHEKFFNADNDTTLRNARISNTYIFFFEDSRHRLWFSSYTGYTMIDQAKVTKFVIAGFGVRGEGIVANGDDGNVNIFTSGNQPVHDTGIGRYHYDDRKFKKNKLRYSRLWRTHYCYLSDKSFLFISKEGIIQQNDTMQQMILPMPADLAEEKIIGVSMTSDKQLFLETMDKGLYCYDMAHPEAPPRRFLENKAIADVIEDCEHNLWIATFGEGVYQLPAEYKAVTNYYCGNYARHCIYCVAKDKNGNIYTGHDEMTVNILKDKKYSELFFINQKKGVGFNRVDKLLVHGDDMWIGTDADLTHVTTHNSYNAVAEVRVAVCSKATGETTYGPVCFIKDIAWYNNNILVCTTLSIFLPDTTGSDLLRQADGNHNRHYCVHADRKGIAWYGASDGLYSNDGRGEVNHAAESSYLCGNIYDISETEDSVLVLASYGNGVLFYKNGKILQHLTEEDGLSSNLCKKIFIQGSDIYVATAAGATRISYHKRHIDSVKTYTTENGLLTNSVNDIYADDSEICFATTDGLTVLNRMYPEVKTGIPILYLTSIKCKDRMLKPDSSYTLSYDQNSLQFTFTAISYRLAANVVYQYRLTEDQKWRETRNMSVDIPYLSDGKYHFQLRARTSNGPWSNIKSFYFTINPPIWKSAWFLAIYPFICAMLVILIMGYRASIVKQKDREQAKIKEQVTYLEQQALQAMMNPHFIFNVMNSIQHYINNNEKHEANIYLSDFARLIRMNLDISSKRYIPLDDEIAYLKLYLSLESLRFGQNLSYEINVDPGIDGDETMVPVMLLQPFIENAIWHGILPKKMPGRVVVNITREDHNMLRIKISDNGVGIPAGNGQATAQSKKHISRGMQMTQQRLDLIGKITGKELHIHVTDAYPGEQYKGTLVEFLLPGDLS